MDIREWIFDYGIAQDFDLVDAIELIASYEDEYVPKFGRLGTKTSEDETSNTPLTGRNS